MQGALETRLRQFSNLEGRDVDVLRSWESRISRSIRAKRDLVRQSDAPTHVRLIVSGWACRYYQLPDGRRQILSILMPGDLAGFGAWLLGRNDHAIATLSDCRVVEIAVLEFQSVIESRESLHRAVMINACVELAVQRQHCVSMGQRNAYERIAHLLYETFLRAQAAGIARDDGCEFPLTQADIADATGLTAVHVNRTLQLLRKEGLIALTSRRLFIPDLKRLARAALYEAVRPMNDNGEPARYQHAEQRPFTRELLQLA